MFYRKLTALIAFMLVVGISAAYADEKLDAVEKQIVAKWEKVKSMTAKMDMTMDVNQGGMQMKTTMKGTVEYLRQDAKMLSRMDTEMETSFEMGGKPNTMKSSMLMVSDGEISHSLIEQMGQKMCVKNKADANSATGADMFKSLRKDYDLTLGDDESIDGAECWAVNAKPKTTAPPNAPAKFVHYFRQKDGANVQSFGFDAADKKIMTTKYTDIKFNEKLDPTRFKFEVPEGVQVMDMTKTP